MMNEIGPCFMLVYNYADDYLDRRGAYRKQHVELAEEFAVNGYLLIAGATDNPADAAYL